MDDREYVVVLTHTWKWSKTHITQVKGLRIASFVFGPVIKV